MTAAATSQQVEAHEKRRVALVSVGAAVLLTAMKLVVGVATGSLGILAEAAHSALDLVAAIVTLFAVRASGRPADRDHAYGHGKVENLSALFETVLLLATCVWIIVEALQRLFVEEVVVDASFWAFAVMGVSIIVDINRSRMLDKAARKYDSQALEADALHFSTDIWSSTVVIIGLALVRLSATLGIPWLAKADAVAALGVAGIVVWVSLQLGRRTLAGLLDETPATMSEEIGRAAQVAGVLEVGRVRVRRSGPDAFADVTVVLNPETAVDRAHDIAGEVEAAVQAVVPRADVTVHVEPPGGALPDEAGLVRALALEAGLGVHSLRFYDLAGGGALELHLEAPDRLTLAEAHARVSAFEAALRARLPGVDRITSHIEPAGLGETRMRVAPEDEEMVREVLSSLPVELGVEFTPHDLQVTRGDGAGIAVSFHCLLDDLMTVAVAHLVAERIETRLRQRLPGLGRVTIHVEPAGEEVAW
jgi:cation diffusion facilitator family transporter